MVTDRNAMVSAASQATITSADMAPAVIFSFSLVVQSRIRRLNGPLFSCDAAVALNLRLSHSATHIKLIQEVRHADNCCHPVDCNFWLGPVAGVGDQDEWQVLPVVGRRPLGALQMAYEPARD